MASFKQYLGWGHSLRRRLFSNLEPYPFRVLFYVEWILLGFTFLNPLFSEVFDESLDSSSTLIGLILPWQFWLLSLLFGGMGLCLPQGNASRKVLYTACEFALILMVGHLCYWDALCFAPLLLITVIRSCFLFQTVGQIVIAVAVFLFFLVANHLAWQDTQLIDLPSFSAAPEEIPLLESVPPDVGVVQNATDFEIIRIQLQSAFFFGLVLVFVLLLINALVSERNNRRKLASAHAQLYDYTLRIEDQATLQERNRIARDIHDSLGHLLMAQSIQLENGLFFLSQNVSQAERFFQSSKDLSTEALKELRSSVTALRSDPFQGDDLVSVMTQSVDNFKRMTGMEIDLNTELSISPSSDVQTVVFRILEEALTNIYKHSDATKVSIALVVQTQDAYSQLVLMIEDNGCGFRVEQNTTGFGLKGMYERATAVGGKIDITSQVGKGSQILGHFPLRVGIGEVA